MLFLRRPFGRRNDACFFAVEINLRDAAEAEILGVLRDLVDAETSANVVEKYVGRYFQRTLDVDVAETFFFRSSKTTAEEDGTAAVIERRLRANCALSQSRNRHHGLEG